MKFARPLLAIVGLLLVSSVAHADTISLTSFTEQNNVYLATFSNGVNYSFTVSTPLAILEWAGPGNPLNPGYGVNAFDVAVVEYLNGQFYSAFGFGNGGVAPINPNDPSFAQQNDFSSWWGSQTLLLPQYSFTIDNVPEPDTILLLTSGLTWLGFFWKQRIPKLVR